jgi:YHS domain-containing protein
MLPLTYFVNKKIMKMKGNSKATVLAVFLFFISTTVNAQENDESRIHNYNLESGLALKGYDPVSYFTAGKAEKGKAEYGYSYKGVNYRFSSVSNRELFKKAPAKYEPAYGGWCAYAMGNDGSKVEIDPETFKIKDNKLYLFYNFYFTNTLKKWNSDENRLKSKADVNWNKILFH